MHHDRNGKALALDSSIVAFMSPREIHHEVDRVDDFYIAMRWDGEPFQEFVRQHIHDVEDLWFYGLELRATREYVKYTAGLVLTTPTSEPCFPQQR